MYYPTASVCSQAAKMKVCKSCTRRFLPAYKNKRGGMKSGLATRDFTDVFCMQLSRDM